MGTTLPAVQSRRELSERIESAVLGGDLSPLSPEERIQYHNAVCEIVLRGERGRGRTATVAMMDASRVLAHPWHLGAQGYPCSTFRLPDGTWASMTLHKFLISPPPGLQVDHINGNKLDNRRCNLRIATNGQNSANKGPRRDAKSGIKGVRWHKNSRMWQARITLDGHTRSLGYFRAIEDAAMAFERAARLRHGAFAWKATIDVE